MWCWELLRNVSYYFANVLCFVDETSVADYGYSFWLSLF